MYLIENRVSEAEVMFTENLNMLAGWKQASLHQLSFSHVGMGLVHLFKHDFQKAEHHMQTSLKWIEQHIHRHGSHHFLAYVYEALGMLATAQNNLQEAYLWISQSIAAKDQLDNKFELAMSWYNLGRVAFKQQRLVLAWKHCICSLQTAAAFGQDQSLPAVAACLAEVSMGFQRPDLALKLWSAAETLKMKIPASPGRPHPDRSPLPYQQAREAFTWAEACLLEAEGATCDTVHRLMALAAQFAPEKAEDGRIEVH